jgi:hypothetical protein
MTLQGRRHTVGVEREMGAASRCSVWTLERRWYLVEGILTIVVVVLIVLFVLGYFGRGRFRV